MRFTIVSHAGLLVESLRPDFIHISHLHRDHFHGPSLRLFDRGTTVIVPKINHRRTCMSMGRFP